MVEETIQVIRETEAQADAKIKEAEAQCKELLDKAAREADSFREEQKHILKQKMEAAMENARQDGNQAQKKALTDIEEEVKSLKESALSKESEAVDLVISHLI